MKNHFDVIVIGVGSMGSSACWHLASRGYRVLGLEQFDIVHEKGSHTGQSRIIRKAYFEHPDYVPLLKRAYENWRKFEMITNSQIYHRTGILYMGKSNSETISGSRSSAELYNIPLEDILPSEAVKRYPMFSIPANFDIFMESDAGFLTPEKAIKLYADEAIKQGATIRSNVKVLNWSRKNNVLHIHTGSENFTCDKMIFTTGSWSSKMLPSLQTALLVTKQILAWINPKHPESFSMENFPCWFVDDPDRGLFYGFPLIPQSTGGPFGMKLAHHLPGESCDPDKVNFDIPATAKENIRYVLDKYLPHIGSNEINFKQCLYTYSKDSNFVIDHLPDYNGQVTIACGFSGHGFKFVSVVGEILADLASKGKTDLPIEFLSLRRFTRS